MLKGKLIQIRTYREKDIESIHDLSAHFSDMGEYWPCDFLSEHKLLKSFRENGLWEEHSGGLLITDTADSRIIGQIFFYKGIPYGSGYEVGYRIFKPGDMGKGYATEALSLLVEYLFMRKPCDRIQATAFTGNEASLTVMEKCGFTREGVLRKAVFHRGMNLDMAITSITRDDWLKRREHS